MKDAFKLRAIETKFQGHRFRSRLEARWAVFFSELGVEYYYEPEGYSLEGTPYLPDFYLPQQDCFVEIKGQEPTNAEQDKSKLLALYTGKNVYTFFGNITLPHEASHGSAYLSTQPYVYSWCPGGGKGGPVEASREVLIILQKLEDAGIQPHVEEGFLTFEYKYPDWSVDELTTLTHFIQNQHKLINLVFPLLKQYEEEIIQTLTPEEGWDTDLLGQDIVSSWHWQECSTCGAFTIGYGKGNNTPHEECQNTSKGTLIHNTPRLIAAYEAARQARFEFGR